MGEGNSFSLFTFQGGPRSRSRWRGPSSRSRGVPGPGPGGGVPGLRSGGYLVSGLGGPSLSRV